MSAILASTVLASESTGQVSEGLGYGVTALYIVSFSLFIYGLMGLTGPKTANAPPSS